MLADQLPWIRRHGRALAIAVIAGALAVPGASAVPGAGSRTAASGPLAPGGLPTMPAHPAARVLSVASARRPARPGPAMKRVSYRGYTFDIPRGWPVVNLARRPRTCVRFNRHVVYLGRSGANQDCPSWLVGTTEAMQVVPAAGKTGRSSVENPVARQITVSAARIRIAATFDTSPTLIYRILASASLPAPIIVVPKPDPNAGRRQASLRANPRALSAARSPRSSLDQAVYS